MQIFLLVFVPSLVEVAAIVALLRPQARGTLARDWLKLCLYLVPLLAAAPFIDIALMMSRILPGEWTLCAAVVFSFATTLSAALLVQWRLGGSPFRPLFWLGTAAAIFSVIVKVSIGGWLLLGEMFVGVAIAVPIVHVLIHLLVTEASSGAALVAASLISDAVLVASTLLRIDAGDTPSYVVYRVLFFGETPGVTNVPDWLTSLVSEVNRSTYDFLLYVPVVACWLLCLWLARANRRLVPA